jgi:ABC-type sugar transport system ATPase subunit
MIHELKTELDRCADASAATCPLLKISDVSYEYRKNIPVVQGVSFTLTRGALVGLIGPNGAGKTTLVKLIRGDMQPSSGQIEFTSLNQDKSAPIKVAVVEQHLSLFPDLSVSANICTKQWASKPYSWLSPTRLREEAQRVTNKLGCEINVDESAKSFSYPVRQMIEVARAIYQGAQLLILDEPTAALDSRSRSRLLSLLKELTAEGVTVLLVTHDMDDLRGVADKVMAMSKGILSLGSIDDEVEPPLHPSDKEESAGTTLDISVKLPSGKSVKITGCLGRMSVWHFEDALDRSLTGQTIAFPQVGHSCRVETEGGTFNDPSTTRLRTLGVRLLLSDRLANCIFPELTVEQNYLLLSGLTLPLVRGQYSSERIKVALERGGISYPSLDAPAFTLSGGNQQRLIWRALADSDARFIVAEEPLWGLDPSARRAALSLMKEIASQGRAVVVLTCFPRSYSGEAINTVARFVT